MENLHQLLLISMNWLEGTVSTSCLAGCLLSVPLTVKYFIFIVEKITEQTS